ncbi:uncharacterized protein Z520_00577 [Fonsecaea multimorphosa CBS 102226]|uniref:Uncharacterized protein n=1 Tax=Fonsecaea multimorphosa CBS 102226 TaxID=1442371 RepID=A0A0D2HPV8_9EURO|nr:uncharacterized protein Z520_00577 [Fonsecaea multimorphosa CBS 102226]KIY03886.1 hypothetical protein Z520_00577 [Fonsecaea multimorphosa CBS 102226]OAL32147.1 hypothetical protein AYO22_00596 [Fonsecaea multimorphosa]
MLQSPPKRRKIDPSLSQTNNGTTIDTGHPTTPRRASYLSPTKSSLARSHPHLLTRSSRRAVTEPRGKLLRDEILGRHDHVSVEVPKTVAPVARSRNLEVSLDLSATKANENPSKEESTVLSEESTTKRVDQAAGNERPALKERQPAQRTTWETSGFSEEPASPAILPKLVPRKETDARPVSRGGSGEPELPPTPVELGLSPAPERPRGLASSSSPRSSKMNSKSGRWRAESRGPVTSSPLKPRAPPAVEPYDVDDENMDDDVQEAPESELGEAQGHNEAMSERRGEQESDLESLKRRLQQLKKENEQLQTAIEDDNNLSEEAVSILQQSLVEDAALRSFGDLGDGGEMSSHLTLFAPGNLQLTARTETKVIRDRTKIIHVLKIEAPPQWLPDAFSCVFEVVVDAKHAQVEHVELKEVMSRARLTRTAKGEIFKWVNDRLEHPLHRLDVGGLIWGIGRWFSAAVERAQVFQWLDIKYNRSSSDESQRNEDDKNQQLTQDRAIELARYLEMTQMAAVDAEMTVTAGGKKFRRKVMLSWGIHLDWAGGLLSEIQISTSGIPQKAEPGLRTIFASLIPTLGVKGAFENIWTLIHGDGDEFALGSTLKGKKKG